MKSFLIPLAENQIEESRCRSLIFNDIYHSKDGAFEEANQTFVEGNQLESRWQNLETDFCIAELGFGYGVSFLAAALKWAETKKNSHLSFLSFEGFPVSKKELSEFYQYNLKSNSQNQILDYFIEELILQLPPQLKGIHRLSFPDHNISLTLVFDNIKNVLHQLSFKANAWFLDGFSPNKNPEMWSEDIFQFISSNTACSGSFATYSVARTVKDHAAKAGFKLRVKKGFKSKRQMLLGENDSLETNQNLKSKQTKRIAIIGGGIAGLSLAHSLCTRGYKVKVYEKEEDSNKGASGNQSAVIMPLLSSKIDDLTQFYLAAYLLSLRTLNQINRTEHIKSLNLKGALRLASVKKWENVINNLSSLGLNAIAKILTQEEVKEVLNITQEKNGLFFTEAGSVKPHDVISAIIKIHRKNLSICYLTEIKEVKKELSVFQLKDQDSKVHEADIVIFANAYSAAFLDSTRWLPVEKIKGQLFSGSLLNPPPDLNFPICYDGYASPISGTNEFMIGATYEHNHHETFFDLKVVNPLIERLEQATGLKVKTEASEINGRVCFRTTSPDRLPMIGQLNNKDGVLIENNYISLGHGSRGMTSCFLAAELIADLIAGSPPPLSLDLIKALAPMRYVTRVIKRNKKLEDIYPASFLWRE